MFGNAAALTLAGAFLTLAACEQKDNPSKPSVPAVPAVPAVPTSEAVFSCDKLPGVGGLRLCYATDKYCDKEGGCFKRPKAQCYIRSAVGNGGWSATEKTVSCFPTMEECTKDRDGVGAWGPPPIQTPCREMSPDEQPN